MVNLVRWESRRWKYKIVQQAVVPVLNQIYKEDFLGFSMIPLMMCALEPSAPSKAPSIPTVPVNCGQETPFR